MSDQQREAGQPAIPAFAAQSLLAFDAFGVFCLALGLRVWHVLALRRSPFFDVLMGDSLGYDAWARRLAAGDWTGGGVFYQAPLYPYFLGSLYTVVSDDLLVIRLTQAVIGSLACVFLALTAARFLQSRAAGIAAGVILALYAPAIFHDALIQKSALDLFWLCGLLWLLSRIQDEPGALLGWASGAALGALTLTRENAGILLLPIAFWLWIHFRGAGRLRAVLLVALLAGVTSVLLPVALRNYSIDGGFHLTTSQFGPNFYHGNNPDADGTYRSLGFARGDPRHESADAKAMAEGALGRELDPGEVSAYWTGQALDYISENPLEWLGVMARKLRLLLNATETLDTEDQYTYAIWSPVLRVSGALLHFGVVAPLALAGVFATWHRRERLWLLYLMGGVYAGSVLLFYVVARYRLPLVPFLVLAIAGGLAEIPALRARLARAPRAAIAVLGAAIATLAFVCNWPFVDRVGMGAANYYNLAIAMQSKGDNAAALTHLRRALELVPQYPEALWAAGVSHAARGELDDAIASYRAAIALRPDIAPVHQSLADALSRKGDIAGGVQHYEEALRLDPQIAAAHFHLAVGLAMSKREEEGRRHVAEAVALDPSLLGRLHEVAWRRATIPGVGTRGSANGRLALVFARWAAGLTHPATPQSLDVLAASYAAAGRFDAAVKTGRDAVRLAKESGDSELAAAVYLRLSLYRQGRPFVTGK